MTSAVRSDFRGGGVDATGTLESFTRSGKLFVCTGVKQPKSRSRNSTICPVRQLEEVEAEDARFVNGAVAKA